MMLKNKHALITGASSGIGKEIARVYASNGCDITLNYFSSAQLKEAEEVKNELEKLGVEVLLVEGDVSNFDICEQIVKKSVAQFGKIDILVNNAGITNDKLGLRMSAEDFKKVIDVNLVGTFNMCRQVYKIMMKQRNGSIINMSSVIGLVGNAGQINYAASKAGVLGLTKSLAKELAPRNVRVNAICPGFIQTAMTDILSTEQKEAMLNNISMNRLGEAKDIANTALFLASELSNYITGQSITVDGGMVM